MRRVVHRVEHACKVARSRHAHVIRLAPGLCGRGMVSHDDDDTMLGLRLRGGDAQGHSERDDGLSVLRSLTRLSPDASSRPCESACGADINSPTRERSRSWPSASSRSRSSPSWTLRRKARWSRRLPRTLGYFGRTVIACLSPTTFARFRAWTGSLFRRVFGCDATRSGRVQFQVAAAAAPSRPRQAFATCGGRRSTAPSTRTRSARRSPAIFVRAQLFLVRAGAQGGMLGCHDETR